MTEARTPIAWPERRAAASLLAAYFVAECAELTLLAAPADPQQGALGYQPLVQVPPTDAEVEALRRAA